MSAENGGAIVRSLPDLVGGVDAYNAHIGKGTKWDHPTPPPLPLSGNQPPQPQKNASVTKLPSGGKGIFNSKNSRKKKHNDKVALQNGISDEDEVSCGCEASTRVRQLEHDFVQLEKIHDAVLKGLHQQMEELKQKNRDLTFQLLMGPYATSVQVGVPQSPESDSATATKEENKKEDKSTSTSETELETTQQQEKVQQYETTFQGEKTYVRRRQRRGRTGDPRQVRSLDIELLEEEADELRMELEREKDKNCYLIALTEDLKRQIRDENGSWHPPQLSATKRAMQPPLKPMPLNFLLNSGSSFRPSQIASLDSQMQRSDALLSSHSSLPDSQLEASASGFPIVPSNLNKKYDKNRLPLPLIGKQASDTRLSSDTSLHLVEELKVEHQGRAGLINQTKPKTRQQLGDIAPQGRNGKTFPFENEKVPPLVPIQTRKDQRLRKQQEVSNRSNEHFIFQSPKKLQEPAKSRKLYHQQLRQTISDQLNIQESPQQTKIKSSQRRRSNSGSMTRGNGNSKTRSLSSQDSRNSRNIRMQDIGSNLVVSETITSACSPEAYTKIRSAQCEREKMSLVTSEPLANGDVETFVKADLPQSSELQETKPKRSKGCKVEFSAGVTPIHPSASSTLKSIDANMTSSSSSIGSLASASGSGRPKNKGRPHRRGRGRNKKETPESKAEGKKQS